jgi:hypothetical protein
LTILKKIQNGEDIVDGAGVDFLGVFAINPVSSGGFSNPTLFWKDLLNCQ